LFSAKLKISDTSLDTFPKISDNIAMPKAPLDLHLEMQLHDLFSDLGSLEKVAEALADRWEKNLLSPNEQREGLKLQKLLNFRKSP
jgi:hypothetical protein